jgi:hypothetical protein
MINAVERSSRQGRGRERGRGPFCPEEHDERPIAVLPLSVRAAFCGRGDGPDTGFREHARLVRLRPRPQSRPIPSRPMPTGVRSERTSTRPSGVWRTVRRGATGFLPSPRYSGERGWGCGDLPVRQTRPPHPRPLSPEYGEEGSLFPAARLSMYYLGKEVPRKRRGKPSGPSSPRRGRASKVWLTFSKIAQFKIEKNHGLRPWIPGGAPAARPAFRSGSTASASARSASYGSSRRPSLQAPLVCPPGLYLLTPDGELRASRKPRPSLRSPGSNLPRLAARQPMPP